MKAEYITLDLIERLDLKRMRVKAGLSVSNVEEFINVTKSKILNAESGKKVEKQIVEKLIKKYKLFIDSRN